jgi:hypothetical protein
MGEKLKLFDFVYEPQNCWHFKDFNELYFGSNYKTSGILRFTNFLYVSNYSYFKSVQKIIGSIKIILNFRTNTGTVVLIQIFCKRSQDI